MEMGIEVKIKNYLEENGISQVHIGKKDRA